MISFLGLSPSSLQTATLPLSLGPESSESQSTQTSRYGLLTESHITTDPLQGMGYGSRALSLLHDHYSGQTALLREGAEAKVAREVSSAAIHSSSHSPSPRRWGSFKKPLPLGKTCHLCCVTLTTDPLRCWIILELPTVSLFSSTGEKVGLEHCLSPSPPQRCVGFGVVLVTFPSTSDRHL